MGLIELADLTVKRGRKTVVSKFSLKLVSGEVVALSGDNGCGKSTIIEAASGLLELEDGFVKISNQLVKDSEGRRGRPHFGLCLQDDCMMGDELVGERLVDVARSKFNVNEILDEWDLSHRVNDRVAMLSGGQRRKLAVISALLPALISDEPIAILLDEPDSGLDEKSVELLATMIRNLSATGHAILIASHNQSIISCADKIISFPFEIKENIPSPGKQINLVKGDSIYSFVGTRLDIRTMSSLGNNAIVGLITLGAMFAFLQPTSLEGNMALAFVLAPSLAAGFCGDPIVRLLQENKSYSWWNTRSMIPPNSIINVSIICIALTTLASASTGDLNIVVISAGGLLGGFTATVVAMISHATLKLSRPNAVMIKLLTPILILPWALLVDTLSQYV